MKVVILCRGLGFRLREETAFRREYQPLNELWNRQAAPWKLSEALPRPVSNR